MLQGSVYNKIHEVFEYLGSGFKDHHLLSQPMWVSETNGTLYFVFAMFYCHFHFRRILSVIMPKVYGVWVYKLQFSTLKCYLFNRLVISHCKRYGVNKNYYCTVLRLFSIVSIKICKNTCPLRSWCKISSHFRENNNVVVFLFPSHIFMPLANLWFICFQGQFPILRTGSCPDVYPLIRPPGRPCWGRFLIPGFIRSPPMLILLNIIFLHRWEDFS